MAGWLPAQSRRKELLAMDIIRQIKSFVNNGKAIVSKIPANSGHSLLPVFAENKTYHKLVFPTILLKHAFESGANRISGNPQLLHTKVASGSLANTGVSGTLKQKILTSARCSTKDALRGLAFQDGVKLTMDIHSNLAPLVPADELAPKKKKSRPQYFIGFDTEYYQDNEARHVLSYQLSTLFDGEMYAWICFAGGKKLPFSVLLSWFFEDMNKQGLNFDFMTSSRIWVVSHFGSVDYTMTENYDDMMEASDSLRKTLVTIEKPVRLKLANSSFHGTTHSIFLRDTTLLAPAGSSLEALGKVLGIGKVEIPPQYDKSDMKTFLDNDPFEFLIYASIDPVVTLHWAFSVQSFTEKMTKRKFLPVTMASLGAGWVKKEIMKQKGWKAKDFNAEFLGRKVLVDDKKGKVTTMQKWGDELVLPMTAANESYYGGRNECFLYGIHHGPWYDYDLAGAYPIGMQMLGTPLLSECHTRTDLKEIGIDEYVCVLVDFEFPDDTPFPCFPIKDDEGRGLIFPLKGRAWATSPEIILARKLGATITPVNGSYYVVPMGDNVFGEVIKVMIENREQAKQQYGKKSIPDLLWKEVSNSVYGKLGQGLSGKRAFSTRKRKTQETPFSSITMPYMAAYVTSFIRACVTAAMTELVRKGYRIASVTTDGFLSDAPPEVVFGLDAYGFGELYRQKRLYVAGKDDMFEIKHKARDLVIFTTRGGFGVGEIKDGQTWELPQAKAGYYFKGLDGNFSSEMEKKNRETEYLAEMFLSRTGRITYEKTILPSLSDYLLKKKEVAKVERKAIKWEYDFKRKPDMKSVITDHIEIGGRHYEHLSFATVPWKDMEEFIDVRKYRDVHEKMYIPLKEERQVKRLMFYATARRDIRRSGYYLRDTKIDDELEILRPYVMALLGAYLRGTLQKPESWKGKSYSQIAALVNETVRNAIGYELGLTKDDMKKAKVRHKGIISSDITESLRSLIEGGSGNVEDYIGKAVPAETEQIPQPA